MKSKTFNKKLVLNKKTVSHLNRGELKAVDGGDEICDTDQAPTCISFQGWTCETCPTYMVGGICYACKYPG